MTGIMQMFVGGARGKYPWEDLQTGDSYLGGVVVRYSTKIAVRWYPASRTTLGLQNNLSNLSTSQAIPIGVSSINIYGVGGGGGGTGGNVCGGGGGGAFSVTNVAVSAGDSISITAGKGGKGGVSLVAGGNPSSPTNYFGNYPTDVGGENGGNTNITVGSIIELTATGGTSGNTSLPNSTDPNDLGQGGTGLIIYNPFAYSVTTGTGGRGGGRTLPATNGSDGGAGGGGGQNGAADTNYDVGGNGSGRFGGGGGGGNGNESIYARLGGTGGTEAGNGGQGGNTATPLFGLNGGYYTGQSAIANAGGRAYIASDCGTLFGNGNVFQKGSAGGGGFPGGGGGGSVYQTDTIGGVVGVGSDGASGIIQIEWALP